MYSELIPVGRLLLENYFHPAKVQRQYIWGIKECATFHNDLIEAYEKRNSSSYYLGPMILVKEEENDLVWVYDGQQRLTTLTIYFATLGQLASGGASATAKMLSLARRENEDRPRINLRTKGGALTRVVRGTKQFRVSPSNMPVDWRIYEIERAFLDRLNGRDNIDDYIRWLQEHVVLNVLWAKDDIGIVLFNRANTRGVHLEWHEMVKSVVSDAVGEGLKLQNRKTLEELWYETQRSSKDEFSDLIGSLAFVRYLEVNESEALAEFEDEFDVNQSVEVLQSRTQSLAQQLIQFGRTAADLQELRERRSGVEHESELMCLQLLFLEYPHWKGLLFYAQGQGLKGERELQFLKRLRRVAYHAHLLDWPAWPTRLNEMFQRAMEELQERFSKGAGVDYDLIDFKPEQLQQARGSLLGALMDASCYRPLVKLSEAQSAHERGVLNCSAVFLAQVEHVLPRAPRDEWCDVFEDEKVRAEMRHKLGNLCLLPEKDNFAASNNVWEHKRKIYNEVPPTFVGAHSAAKYDQWDAAAIENRTDVMADQLIRILDIGK